MAIKEVLSAMTLKAKIFAVSAAVLVVGTVGTIIGLAVAKEDEYRVVKVFEMTGEAVVQREGTGELSAYVGMNLENGDILTVGEDSTLRISMDNDKYVLLDSGTVLKLNATGTSSDSKTKIELMRGEILNEITKPLSSNSSYEVATPKATMAVRGTSFVVKVEEDGNGGYITNQQTLQGKVEVELLSPDGKKTGKKVIVSEDKSVTIVTTPNEESGNSADVDGTSFFVIEDANGDFIIVTDPEEAVSEIDYTTISDNIKQIAIYSDDTRLMVLDEVVARKIREALDDEPETTTPEETTTPLETTSPEETTVPEVTTIPEVTTVPEETTIPAPLTLPEETTISDSLVYPEETSVPGTAVISGETSGTGDNAVVTTGSGGIAILDPETTTTEEEVIEYTVEFVYNGNVVETVTVEEGETVPASSFPTVDSLNGNADDQAVYCTIGGEEFTSSDIVNSDLTVTVELANVGTISFLDLNGNLLDSVKLRSDQTLQSIGYTPPEIPNVPAGNTANYFYNKRPINLNMYYNASDHTYKAELTVKVTFLKSDGALQEEFEFIKDRSFSYMGYSVPTPEVSAGTSGEWLDENGDIAEISDSNTTFSKNTTYSVREFVTVRFLDKDGDIIEEQKTYTRRLSSVPTPPTEPGYTFIGWYDENGTPITVDENALFTENCNIIAKYEVAEYEVLAFYYNNMSTPALHQAITTGQTVTLPGTPTGFIAAKSDFVWVEISDGFTGTGLASGTPDYTNAYTYNTTSITANSTTLATGTTVGVSDSHRRFIGLPRATITYYLNDTTESDYSYYVMGSTTYGTVVNNKDPYPSYLNLANFAEADGKNINIYNVSFDGWTYYDYNGNEITLSEWESDNGTKGHLTAKPNVSYTIKTAEQLYIEESINTTPGNFVTLYDVSYDKTYTMDELKAKWDEKTKSPYYSWATVTGVASAAGSRDGTYSSNTFSLKEDLPHPNTSIYVNFNYTYNVTVKDLNDDTTLGTYTMHFSSNSAPTLNATSVSSSFGKYYSKIYTAIDGTGESTLTFTENTYYNTVYIGN